MAGRGLPRVGDEALKVFGHVVLLAACVAAVLLVESDVQNLADLSALNVTDVVFLAFYALLLYGLVRFATRYVRRLFGGMG